MRYAIIGSTGLLGKNIAEIYSAELYSSANIKDIGIGYDLLFVAAPSAKKWVAAANPEGDRQACEAVANYAINSASKKVIYFSTIDVYSAEQIAAGVDEDCLPVSLEAYGSNRRFLESKLIQNCLDVSIIRLPGLFGKFLSKNPIFDIKTNNQVGNIKANSYYQWFNLAKLNSLINFVLGKNIKIINVVNPPIQTSQVLDFFPNVKKHTNLIDLGPNYNLKSKFGYSEPDKDSLLSEIISFINEK